MNIDRRPQPVTCSSAAVEQDQWGCLGEPSVSQTIIIPGAKLEIDDGEVIGISFEQQPILLATLL